MLREDEHLYELLRQEATLHFQTLRLSSVKRIDLNGTLSSPFQPNNQLPSNGGYDASITFELVRLVMMISVFIESDRSIPFNLYVFRALAEPDVVDFNL